MLPLLATHCELGRLRFLQLQRLCCQPERT